MQLFLYGGYTYALCSVTDASLSSPRRRHRPDREEESARYERQSPTI